MLKVLGFYNSYGAGDIFESREFVRELMDIFSAEKYIYYTGKSPRLLMDIPNLEVSNDFLPELSAMRPFVYSGDELYINTWIGRDGRYVLPGIGCTVEKLYEMYNAILSMLNAPIRLQKPMLSYLTNFNYSVFDIKAIDKYMATPKEPNEKFVYISNGNVQSNQAKNFDMSPMIEQLAEYFPEATFFITSPFETDIENIVDANFFAPGLETNLPELSYLSTFCDVLIGRNSGAHVFAWTYDNCMRDILNLTLTYRVECSHFVYKTPIAMKRVWSNHEDTETLVGIAKSLLETEFSK